MKAEKLIKQTYFSDFIVPDTAHCKFLERHDDIYIVQKSRKVDITIYEMIAKMVVGLGLVALLEILGKL